MAEGGLEVLAVHPFHFDDVAAVLSRLSQRAANSGDFQAADDVELVVKLRDVGRRRKLVVEHLDRSDRAGSVFLPAEDLGFLALVDKTVTHLVHAPFWTSTSRDFLQYEFASRQILVPVEVICGSRRVKSRATTESSADAGTSAQIDAFDRSPGVTIPAPSKCTEPPKQTALVIAPLVFFEDRFRSRESPLKNRACRRACHRSASTRMRRGHEPLARKDRALHCVYDKLTRTLHRMTSADAEVRSGSN